MTATGEADDAIAEALTHHRAGRLAEAEAAYRQALAVCPGHPRVLHNLGVVSAQRGDRVAALALFDSALAADPDYAEAHLNRAAALEETGRGAEALAAYDRVIALRPGHPEPPYAKGEALRRLERLDEAESCYRQALALRPDHYGAQFALGLTLNAGGRHDDAMTAFETTLAMRRGPRPSDPNHYSFHRASRLKLRHDAAQFRYLASRGIAAPRFTALADDYAAVGQTIEWPEDDAALVPLTEPARARLGESYNRPIHRVPAPACAGGAVNPALDVGAITQRYVSDPPGVAWFDDLLTADALQALERYLLESTIWFDFAHIGGFLAAYLEDGLACPLLLQIGEELRRRFSDIFGARTLTQAWAFKCVHGRKGIDLHADDAEVSVNFWVTPDAANRRPDRGGLVVYTTPPPADWRLGDYNADIGRIRGFLDRHGESGVVIPYRANRAVLFASRLFHGSDEVDFAPGYANHRINITMLFGQARR